MTELIHRVPVGAEYDPKKRSISLNRIFQIPQMFRPAASVFFANTLGLLNLDRPAIGLTAIAGWFRFARWRRMHPIARPADGKRRDRLWLYENVIAKENLNSAPIDFWEFGVFKGESLFWWVDHLRNPDHDSSASTPLLALPERWRATEPKGAFNVYGRIPETNDSRCHSRPAFFRIRCCPSSPPRFLPPPGDPSRRGPFQLDAFRSHHARAPFQARRHHLLRQFHLLAR